MFLDRAVTDESLQADVTAEDEGGDEHENNKKHGSNGVDCGQLRDVVNANLNRPIRTLNKNIQTTTW